MRAVRLGLGSLATLVLVAGLSLATPTATLASNGFIEKATTTYVVNAEKQRLDVTIDLTFKNIKKPTSTVLYYYNSDYLWLEKDATNIKATGNFDVMRITKEKTSGQYSEYRFHFSPVIYYGKTKNIHITYQIPTGDPRSDSWFRISPAYLDFCVIGNGLDGGKTEIKVPMSYTMSVDSEENGTLGQTISGDTRVYTTGTNSNAYKFWACLSGEQADKYATTSVKSPSGREIDIQAWPDDPSWSTEIKGQIDDVLSELEKLIGQGLPGDGPISVREVGVGTLGQYGGFFDPDTGIARIGEDLEAKGLITHELSHAWFNGDLFQAHWLSEGHAEWARTSIDGDTCPTPTYPGTGKPNIDNWKFAGPRATDDELAIIDYQYAAACALIRQVAGKIGDEGMRTVIEAILNHDLAYRSGDEVLKGAKTAASWQTWLDLIDEVALADENTSTEVATVADMLEPYGIVTGASNTLAQRARTRQQFHTLKAVLGEWTVPPVVLQAMASWHFDTASTAMGTIQKVYEASAKVSGVLPGADGFDGKPRTLMEAAATQADLDAALASAEDRLAAAAEVKAAWDASTAQHDVMTQVGLLGTNLQPMIDAAVQAIQDDDRDAARAGAKAVQAALADAASQGPVRVLLAVGIPLLLLLVLVFFLLRRRRRRAALVLAASGANLAALDAALAPPPAAIDAPPPAIDAPSPEEPPSS